MKASLRLSLCLYLCEWGFNQAVEKRMGQILLSRSIKTGLKIDMMTTQMNRQCCWGPEAEWPESWEQSEAKP